MSEVFDRNRMMLTVYWKDLNDPIRAKLRALLIADNGMLRMMGSERNGYEFIQDSVNLVSALTYLGEQGFSQKKSTEV